MCINVLSTGPGKSTQYIFIIFIGNVTAIEIVQEIIVQLANTLLYGKFLPTHMKEGSERNNE